MDMFTNTVSIEIKDSVEEAPKYTNDYKLLKLEKLIVVGEGAVSGNPTADLQLVDQDGNKYVVMSTGGIIETMGAAMKGKRERDEETRRQASRH